MTEKEIVELDNIIFPKVYSKLPILSHFVAQMGNKLPFIDISHKNDLCKMLMGQNQINGNNNGRHFFVSDFKDWIELIR